MHAAAINALDARILRELIKFTATDITGKENYLKSISLILQEAELQLITGDLVRKYLVPPFCE